MSPLLSLRRFIVAMNSLPNNALNVKAYNYALQNCSALLQKWATALLECLKICTHVSAPVLLTIALLALTCWMMIWQGI